MSDGFTWATFARALHGFLLWAACVGGFAAFCMGLMAFVAMVEPYCRPRRKSRG